MMSVLPLLSVWSNAWRRMLTLRGLLNSFVFLLAAQLVFALLACRTVFLP